MPEAPSSRQWFAGFTHPKVRAINNEYHAELTAENTNSIRSGLIELTRMQAQAAVVNLRAGGEVNGRSATFMAT